jgi:hypothetical protein
VVTPILPPSKGILVLRHAHPTNITGGSGLSPTPNQSLEAHRENIRAFLAEIVDPATGYIEDD